MEMKRGYKQTEVGVIPEDWYVAELRSVCSMKSGEGITSAHIDQYSRYPCYGGNGLRGFTDRFTHDGSYALIGRQGALCGNVTSASGRFFASEHAVVVTASPKTDISWLTFVLGEMRLNRFSESSAQPGLSVSKILMLRVAAPPTKAEQRAIAAALSDVDALLGGLDRVITKKRDLKQAAMRKLLAGEIRLPGFRGGWEIKRLGDVAVLNRQSVTPASEPKQPFIHFSLPAFDNGKTAQVELGAEIGSNKFRVPSNAVLLSKLNPRIARVWAPDHVPENACASTEWLVLTPGAGTERSFLFFLCSSPSFCRHMELAATGTTGSHQRTSPNTALDIRVSVPVDQEEQIAIATVLSDMDAELSMLEKRRSKYRNIKQAMMQELLTGRTRLPLAEASV